MRAAPVQVAHSIPSRALVEDLTNGHVAVVCPDGFVALHGDDVWEVVTQLCHVLLPRLRCAATGLCAPLFGAVLEDVDVGSVGVEAGLDLCSLGCGDRGSVGHACEEAVAEERFEAVFSLHGAC